jgi:outer membrane murein-binding lipoprotein Lpp
VKTCQDESHKLSAEHRKVELEMQEAHQRLDAKMSSLHSQHIVGTQQVNQLSSDLSSLTRKTSQYETTLESVHSSLSAIKAAVKASAKAKSIATVAETRAPAPIPVSRVSPDADSSVHSVDDSPQLVSRYSRLSASRPLVSQPTAISSHPVDDVSTLSIQPQDEPVTVTPIPTTVRASMVTTQQQTDAVHAPVSARSTQVSPVLATTTSTGQQTAPQSTVGIASQTSRQQYRDVGVLTSSTDVRPQHHHLQTQTEQSPQHTVGVQATAPAGIPSATPQTSAPSQRHTQCVTESGDGRQAPCPSHTHRSVRVTIDRLPSASSTARSRSVTHRHQHTHRVQSSILSQPSSRTTAVHPSSESVWYTTPCSSCDRGYVETMSSLEQERIRQRVREDVTAQAKLRRK